MCLISLAVAGGLGTTIATSLASIGVGAGTALAVDIGAALGVGAAGTALSVAGQAASAEQQQAALDFEAEQAEANRKLYEQQARDIAEQGEWEKRNLALKQQSALASRQASAAASGVLLNYGSNLTMQEDQAQTDLYDMKQLQYDIESRQYQARLGAWRAENQVNSLNAQKDNARIAGNLGIAGAAVSGVGSTMSLAASTAGVSDKLVSGMSSGLSSLKTAPTLTQKTGFGAGPGAFEPWHRII